MRPAITGRFRFESGALRAYTLKPQSRSETDGLGFDCERPAPCGPFVFARRR